MLEDLSEYGFWGISELTELRLEALQLFEQALATGDISDLVHFIERHLAEEPPHLLLLHALAEDLEQRLLTLRTHLADVRERVVRLLQDAYGVDITPLAPDDELERYHTLQSAAIIDHVLTTNAGAAADVILLRHLIGASLSKAAQLQAELRLTGQVFALLDDWLAAIKATAARRYGHFPHESTPHLDWLH